MTAYDQYPRIVIWEVTQACQLACVHCRAEAKPFRDPYELSTEEGFRLIDEIATLQKPLLILTGGDPMERPDLLDLVKHAVAKGLTVALSPSATEKVTFEKLVALKAAGIHRIAISLDGIDAQTHDSFRGVPGTFDRACEMARRVRELGIPLQVNTTITRYNQAQVGDMAALVQKWDAILWSVFFLVPMGRAEQEAMISAEECEQVLERLCYLSREVRFAIKTTEAPHYRRILAQQGVRSISSKFAINDAKGFVFISYRGDVYPSGFLPLNAGNVRREPLGAIYRDSSLFKALRDPETLKGKCRVCQYRIVCGGSRARAYAMTGDPVAPDPLCAYQPTTLAAL